MFVLVMVISFFFRGMVNFCFVWAKFNFVLLFWIIIIGKFIFGKRVYLRELKVNSFVMAIVN